MRVRRMFGGFVPEQIAWSKEGTGLQSETELAETLEEPLRRFTAFESGEVKFPLIPQHTVVRATFKKQKKHPYFECMGSDSVIFF